MNQQRGFTLIELIIVIVILGILAVTAAPRFFDFGGDARESSIQGLAGSINGAMNTVYARAAVDGALGESDQVEGIDTVFGYPAASEDGIIAAAQLNAEEADEGEFSATAEWAYDIDGSSIYITLASILDGEELNSGENDVEDTGCFVQYKETTSANTPPAVTVDVTGC